VAAKVLNERVPLFSHKTLTGWWTAKDDVGGAVVGGAVAGSAAVGGAVVGAQLGRPVGAPRRDDARVRVLRHFGRRATLTLRIADAMETIARTSELARVFGIDFHRYADCH
jgi:DNA polymerase zeta